MNYEEHYTQTACLNWMRTKYPFLGNLLYAVPNGQQRTKAQAAILKSEGMQRGIADICLDLPNDTFHAMRIEMKTKKGTTSMEQDEYALRCTAVGIYYCVVRSREQFEKEVNDYMAHVPFSVLNTLEHADGFCQKLRIDAAIKKEKREAEKAAKELKKFCEGSRPSTATEKARQELQSFLKKHSN